MRTRFLTSLLCAVMVCGDLATAQHRQASVSVTKPTVIAFFSPVSEKELANDPDTNEALADFQEYAMRVREPLRKLGIDFHEVYANTFQIRVGKKVSVFRPRILVGYYFIAPGKQPRVAYGVETDDDVLYSARRYFGLLPQ